MRGTIACPWVALEGGQSGLLADPATETVVVADHSLQRIFPLVVRDEQPIDAIGDGGSHRLGEWDDIYATLEPL